MNKQIIDTSPITSHKGPMQYQYFLFPPNIFLGMIGGFLIFYRDEFWYFTVLASDYSPFIIVFFVVSELLTECSGVPRVRLPLTRLYMEFEGETIFNTLNQGALWQTRANRAEHGQTQANLQTQANHAERGQTQANLQTRANPGEPRSKPCGKPWQTPINYGKP